MILSASRRTDIPAFYLDWFLNRLAAGEVLVRNPMRPNQVSRIDLKSEPVDGIVFWTKNPQPLLDRLDSLALPPFYILYTLNPYGGVLEADLPSESERVKTFLKLAEKLGPDRVVWRYDPIAVTPEYSVSRHEEMFARLARALGGATRECKTSFYQPYSKTRKAMDAVGAVLPSPDEKIALATRLRDIAGNAGIRLTACCDPDLAAAGLEPAACVDAERMSRIAGRPLAGKKDSGQRPGCSCSASVDVGAYDTCTHACRYCYATRSPKLAAANRAAHDPASPLLSGTLRDDDVVTDRRPAKKASDGGLFSKGTG